MWDLCRNHKNCMTILFLENVDMSNYNRKEIKKFLHTDEIKPTSCQIPLLHYMKVPWSIG